MQLYMKLDTTYKLPRMRYKGAAGPQPQHVRAAPKQLITEARLHKQYELLYSADPAFTLLCLTGTVHQYLQPAAAVCCDLFTCSRAASAVLLLPDRMQVTACSDEACQCKPALNCLLWPVLQVADDRSAGAPAFALRVDKPKAPRASGNRGSPPAVALAQPQQQPSLQQLQPPAPQPPQQQQQSATIAAVPSGAALLCSGHLARSTSSRTNVTSTRLCVRPPQALTLACCLPADMSHTLDFEGSPATAARITVHSPALRGSRAGACCMSATHDTVTFRLDQQQLEVQQPTRVTA